MERLAALDYPDYDVIVVDNRREASEPLELPGARVVREPRPGISAARNRGLAAAAGEIVAFTDDDVVVNRRWLRALGERFARQPGWRGDRPRRAAELETAAQVWFERSGSGPDRGFVALTFERAGRFHMRRRVTGTGAERVDSLYATGELGLGSNMAFRLAAARAVGGFDEALGTGTPSRGGEDLAMLVELLVGGHRLAYEPAAIVHHTHRATAQELEHQIHGYGVGFTAMLTAITLRDPRHLVGLAAVAPRWVLSLHDPVSAKRAVRPRTIPPSSRGPSCAACSPVRSRTCARGAGSDAGHLRRRQASRRRSRSASSTSRRARPRSVVKGTMPRCARSCAKAVGRSG